MNNYLKIADLPVDEKTTTVLLLQAIEERETQKHSPYCVFTLSDGETVINANLWNTAKSSVKVEEKTVITATLYVKMYKEALSYEVYGYTEAPEDCKIEDFVIHAPYRAENMYDCILKKLREYVPKDSDGKADLVDLTTAIYEKYKEKLLTWGAAKSIHHNIVGGWLYHSFRMLQSAICLSRIYPILDKELLFCGTALHDIGKVIELETDALGVSEYTIDGCLFGHALLGIEIINEMTADPDAFSTPERVKLLKHMLASHHGKLDYGAVVIPATPEATMLHYIDMIDSRLYQFEDVYKKLEAGELSDRIFGLDNARVYKPGSEE